MVADHVEGPKTRTRGAAIRGDRDDILHLQMIEKESIHRAVVALGEDLAEPIAIQASHAGTPFVETIEKAYRSIVGEQVTGLII